MLNRLFLGKHTLDQVILGALIGIWNATFFHFNLRDVIYSHFVNITNGQQPLEKAQVQKYGMSAFALASSLFLSTVFLAYFSSTSVIEQAYLRNLKETCGMSFETAEGNLITNRERLFLDTIFQDTVYFGIFGLYLGQLLFRYKQQLRLNHDAFCYESFFSIKQAGK